MYISYNKNLTTIKIIYLVLISVFIANINTLIKSIFELLILFLRYINPNLISKNKKITKT